LYVGELDKLPSRCSQILKSVPNVGSERDSGSHIVGVIVIGSLGGLRPPPTVTCPTHPASSKVPAAG